MNEVYENLGKQAKTEYDAWINVTNSLAGSEIYDKAVEIYKKI
mgnify:CR=1 FL=1